MDYNNFIQDLNFLGQLYSSGRGFVPEIEEENNIKVIYNSNDDVYNDYFECIEIEYLT